MSENGNQDVQRFWSAFHNANKDSIEIPESPPEIWEYGGNEPDYLVKLTWEGKKTATSSLLWIYEHFEEAILPKVGDLSVVINNQKKAICVTRTEEVKIVPFNEVGAMHASLEGEGDRSLEYWRKIHWEFFSSECANIGITPGEKMPVVCERFSVPYKIEEYSKK